MEQTLGKRIMANRKRLGLTQDQLAEKLGVSSQAVSKWENDQTCPDISMLPRLAEIFGISIDVLLGREEQVFEAEVVQAAPKQEKKRKTNFSFTWENGRRGALTFALWVLAVGGLYLASQLLQWNIGLWQILWPTALVALGVQTMHRRFSFFSLGCLLFGGYFVADLFIDLPVQWDSGLIWAVIIVIFGVSLLADAIRKPQKPYVHIHRGYDDDDDEDEEDDGHRRPRTHYQYDKDYFNYEASFGEGGPKVDLPVLRRGDINVSFGDYTVELSDTMEIAPNCRLEANCSFGELTLRVPRKFQVSPASSNAFASTQVRGKPADSTEGIIGLNTNCSFGQIVIEYI